MRKTGIFTVKVAGAGALALLLAASAFAESRPQDRTWRDGDRRETYRDRGDRTYERHSEPHRRYRDNERVTMRGGIARYSHERGGYRLWLDGGGYPFWVPDAGWRRDWRVGAIVSLGGVYRGGVIYMDAYDDRSYDDRYDRRGRDSVTGVVHKVDYRRGTLALRDQRTGYVVAVDMRDVDRSRSRLELRDVRRGDRVTLVGEWERRGIFDARRIDAIDSRY